MKLAAVSLEDKYIAEQGQVFLTGTQALVRLPMMQYRLDQSSNINSAGYISGYRGSPLGGFDKALWQAEDHLKKHNISFQPGVNEDLAATALWGTQQSNLYSDGRYDGIFGIWYGKSPGVDRSIDVFKHANLAGTAHLGGVLVLAGDDHVCASSTTAHQSEYDLKAAMMPVFNPSGVQEIIDYGLYGWALSRYSGLWISFVCIAETLDSSAIVSIDPERISIKTPEDFYMPPDGLNIRWPDTPLDQEKRLLEYKISAAQAFVRKNKLDRTIIDGPGRRFGIVTCGKGYLDVRQALEDLGLNLTEAQRLGISIYKPAMTWPLEPEGIIKFCSGLEKVLVVEEKRGLLEEQIKSVMYNINATARPEVYGKCDAKGQILLRATSELNSGLVVAAIKQQFGDAPGLEIVKNRATKIQKKLETLENPKKAKIARIPYFCSGCPHNRSTKVPEGSRALAGIGCHYMAQWMDRDTATYTHMGGEGANWIGQAPFSKTSHVFQNLGDGTYFHSGSLAIRAAIAAKVNITYKILYNDAVAMTGGQPMDGPISVPLITQQIKAEGVKRIAVVSDNPDKYPINAAFADGVTIHHRDELDMLQKEMRQIDGVSCIVYDQMCATEKRRRRKRGKLEDPKTRVMINPEVCEGCGDCGNASNCLSVIPIQTELGRKRSIDQSSCNKDYSCVDGFCPSFVLVKGGQLRRKNNKLSNSSLLNTTPEPKLPSCKKPYGILITGIGGTGIITLGALLGMAARLEGKAGTVLDKAGMAQKYGAVTTHVRIAEQTDDLHAVRIGSGGANLLLGCDMLVAGSEEASSKLNPEQTHAVINSNEAPTGEFTRDPDLIFPGSDLKQLITNATIPGSASFINATAIATKLVGDSIGANLFLLGFAYQKALIPLSAASIEQAISLNGLSVEANHLAFRWGRAAAIDMKQVLTEAGLVEASATTGKIETTVESFIQRRKADLILYQNKGYAKRYTDLLSSVLKIERDQISGMNQLSDAVARSYYKLLAYKDEYEVARLYSDGRFKKLLKEQFEGDFSLQFSLAPPILAKRSTTTGYLEKRTFGPWVMTMYSLLAKLKFLRNTKLDIFGYTKERRAERRQIIDYEVTVDRVLRKLTPNNYDTAVKIASLPLEIRGFGHVKERNFEITKGKEHDLLQTLDHSSRHPDTAAAE